MKNSKRLSNKIVNERKNREDCLIRSKLKRKNRKDCLIRSKLKRKNQKDCLIRSKLKRKKSKRSSNKIET